MKIFLARGGVEILWDDEEADVAAFMLNACGLESSDFYDNERVLTRENLEKNLNMLEKMAETRRPGRAAYFVIGYFALYTGAKISDNLRNEILGAARWKHEANYWLDKGFAFKRKVYLEDFAEKIKILRPGKKLHTSRFKYSEEDFINSKVILGLNQFQDFCANGRFQDIDHINLDGWDLEEIPKGIFEFKNLKSLSLEFNQITEISPELLNLKTLKHLFLGYNQFKKLPESIGTLLSLKSLSIIHNDIFELPESLKYQKNLKYVYVRGTKITQLPNFFENASYDEMTHIIRIPIN